MNQKVLGIFSYPWPEEYASTPLRRRTPWALFHKAVWTKANPRNEEYMQALFSAFWPGGDFVNVNNDPDWHRQVPSADTVIFLYPDAIGLGFRPIESQIFKTKKTSAAVRVLNGRKREFLLSRSVRWRLYMRRFLERWMLGEILALVIFLLATPVLLIPDLVRGRR